MPAYEDNWRTPGFRQSVVSALEKLIQRSGVQVARNSSEMENHVFMKAKSRENYMNMIAKIIIHIREMSKLIPNQGANQGQPQQEPNNQEGLLPDTINALQKLALAKNGRSRAVSRPKPRLKRNV